MIGYHGTSVPEKTIREEGLRILTPARYLDFLLRHLVQPPAKTVAFIRASSITSPAESIAFYTDKGDAEDWSTRIPEVLGYHLAASLPQPIGELVVKVITEVVGDRVIGKVMTVDLPDEWIEDPRVKIYPGGSDREIVIPWDVSPKYIRNIERITGPTLKEYLKEFKELVEMGKND